MNMNYEGKNESAKKNHENIHGHKYMEQQCPCMAKKNSGVKPEKNKEMMGVNLKGQAGKKMPPENMSYINGMMPAMGMPCMPGMMPWMGMPYMDVMMPGMAMPYMNQQMAEMGMPGMNQVGMPANNNMMAETDMLYLSEEVKPLLVKLMEIDFALIEFNLYLDTHPFDRRALIQYNNYLAMRPPILQKLNEIYGPITNMQRTRYPWAWLNQPWPWRINF